MKNQPVLDLPKSAVEVWLDLASWLFVTITWGLAIGYFSDLPEQIPTHFNASGKADGFGSKNTIFLLPAISLALVGGLIYLAKFPHKFNYINKIIPENATFEYRKARIVLSIVNALTSLMFMIITWNVLEGAIAGTSRLGAGFWLVFIALEIAPLTILLGWNKKSGH